MYACSGILFNHESPRRGETFVTRKIVQALDKISRGEQNILSLGNLNAKRDWGHAKDYVEMQWMMLQQELPDDFVIATGVQHSVRDFVEAVAREMSMEIAWRGSGINEVGSIEGKDVIKVDPRYFRPTEVVTLLGDASKAREKLGWVPKISFQQLVSEMARTDLDIAKRDQLVNRHGYTTMEYNE
jgi:GDPmannose 4,6-dehydratase